METHQTLEKQGKEFKVGDKVWLLLVNMSSKRPAKKLDNKKGGPFTIIEKISSHAYRLDLPKIMRVHNVFHANLLSPTKEDNNFHRKQIKPPPIITEEGEEEYEVDHVVHWEWQNGKLYYQIWWKGYDLIEDTMERAKKFPEMKDILDDLHRRLPDTPMPAKLSHRGNDLKEKTKTDKQQKGKVQKNSPHLPSPLLIDPTMNPIMNNKVYLGSKHHYYTHRRWQPRPKTTPYNYTRGTVMGTPMERWMDETLCGSVEDARRKLDRQQDLLGSETGTTDLVPLNLNASMQSLVVSAPPDNNAAEPETYNSGYKTNAEEKECDAALVTELERALMENLPQLTTMPQEGQRVEELEEFVEI
ncbi:hypothetical protein FRC09_005309 [Ceratobasidium sp. 395]|nr:hypothetical protein FRC09_005309 [Ceratobasidium sp. 395]